MPDRKGLRLLGWIYAAVSATVALIALAVVTAHVNSPVAARPQAVILSER